VAGVREVQEVSGYVTLFWVCERCNATSTALVWEVAPYEEPMLELPTGWDYLNDGNTLGCVKCKKKEDDDELSDVPMAGTGRGLVP
jgi:hypothetical protein